MGREVFRHRMIYGHALLGRGYRVGAVPAHSAGHCDPLPQVGQFEPAVQVSAPNIIELHALRSLTGIVPNGLQRFNRGRRSCLAHVNLIGLPLTFATSCSYLAQSIRGAEYGLGWQEPEPGFASRVAGDSGPIDQRGPQHLEPAADADDERTPVGGRDDRVRHAACAQPAQASHGVFRAG